MKVKICGITNADDAVACEELGADALGFVHYPGRRRSLGLETISEICSTLGPMTVKVLVAAPQDPGAAVAMLDRSGADVIQLHSLGPRDVQEVRESGVRVIRAVKPDIHCARPFADCSDALLFESGVPGSGTRYDYSEVPVDCCRRAIIAGGLGVDNLASAKAMGPYALDVSSGVESAHGRKDHDLVAQFIRGCR